MDTATQVNGNGSTLRYWHVILGLIIQFILYVAFLAYASGRITQHMEDTDRRVSTIENDKMISRDEFNAWKVDMEERLGRIEGAIIERNRIENEIGK